jgi:hypothetical protein
MAKNEPKTRPTDASVDDFLNAFDAERRTDCFRVLEIFKKVSGDKPQMWGTGIVGFGSRMIKYSDGRELDWPVAAFAPRKGNITLYVLNSSPALPQLLEKLGKYKASGGCLHIKRLSDVDEKVLEALIKASVKTVKQSAKSVSK